MTTSPEFDWDLSTWDVAEKPFAKHDYLVQHQVRSFENLIEDTIPRLGQHATPGHEGIEVTKGNKKYTFRFLKFYISKPLQHLNRGFCPLFPHECRLRDLNYSAPVFVDYEQKFNDNGSETSEIIRRVPLFKLPIMLGSKYCHLYGKTPSERVALGECKYDRGGYFIINGSEKIIISQERPVDNKIMCFKEGESSSQAFIARSEVKSTIDQRFYPIKTCQVQMLRKGDQLVVQMMYVKKPIPLFVMFKALGKTTDKEIFQSILGDLTNTTTNKELINMILPSAQDETASGIRDQLEAIAYISDNITITYAEKEQDGRDMKSPDVIAEMQERKLKYTKDIINREFLAHVGQDNTKKACFLANMTRKLLHCLMQPELFSDRDHYANKRVDLAGPLLAQIIRHHFQKLVRDIKIQLFHDLKQTGKLSTNIRKVIQKNNIEAKVKYALSTGNWYTNKNHANQESKKGIAQVYQRLAFLGSLAHSRRVQSPLERAGSKHEPPRRFHATQVGKICPAETPEGHQVGTVKNMALHCHVSIECSSYPIKHILDKMGIVNIVAANPLVVPHRTNVFVNGDLIGIIDGTDSKTANEKTQKIYQALKMFKINGKIGTYTSISWDIELNELLIYTDGGRYCRPLYIIDNYQVEDGESGQVTYRNNRFKMDHLMNKLQQEETRTLKPEALAKKLKEKVNWKQLISGYNDGARVTRESGAYIEYIDTNEDECSAIAIFPYQLVPGRVHTLIDGKCDNAQLGFDGCTLFKFDKMPTNDELHSFISRLICSNDKNVTRNGWKKLWNDHIEVTAVHSFLNGNVVADLAIKDGVIERDFDVQTLITNINKFIYPEYTTYTHCEIHPAMWHSVVAQMIPYPDHNQSPRNCYQSSMGKQAIGIFATNYDIRVDTMANIMCYPQRPLVETRTTGIVGLKELPHGFQSIVAIATYSGYNQEDSVILNGSALERGMFNSVFYRTYTDQRKHKTASSSNEQFGIPKSKGVIGRRVFTKGKRDPYHAIARDGKGYPVVGRYVNKNDVLLAKWKTISSKDSSGAYTAIDASTLAKEPGIVDFVIPNEKFSADEQFNEDNYPFIKARVAKLRIPEMADKLASRSAQKGTIGMIFPQELMPMTESGMTPDIIMNPHAIPSRMTIAQIIEALKGKAAAVTGKTRDATPFTKFDINTIKSELEDLGYEENGYETMYNGITGEMFDVQIFINPTYYQRLKHMVADKIHSREMGPLQLLTRQPAEGRSRDGGLRIGEMERDCFIAHGAARYLKEKTGESSDLFKIYVSKDRKDIVTANPDTGIFQYGTNDIYETDEIYSLNIPFAQRLLLGELRTILVDVNFTLDE